MNKEDANRIENRKAEMAVERSIALEHYDEQVVETVLKIITENRGRIAGMALIVIPSDEGGLLCPDGDISDGIQMAKGIDNREDMLLAHFLEEERRKLIGGAPDLGKMLGGLLGK